MFDVGKGEDGKSDGIIVREHCPGWQVLGDWSFEGYSASEQSVMC